MAKSKPRTAMQLVFQNHLYDFTVWSSIDAKVLRETLLKDKNVAHLGSSFYYLRYRNIKSVHVPGTWTDQIGFGVPKNWPHLATMNYHIQRMREFGLLSLLRAKWSQTKTGETGSSSEAFSISYEHTQFPFVFIEVMCGISLILVIAERMSAKIQSCLQPNPLQ